MLDPCRLTERYKEIRTLLRDLRFIRLTDIDYYNHILSVIDLLPLRYSYVLKEHYVNLKRLWTVAYESYYSIRSIERFHQRAISMLEGYYEILFEK